MLISINASTSEWLRALKELGLRRRRRLLC